MKQLLNTLYVMTQGSYLTLDHETIKVEVEGKVQLQVPLHHLGGIVTTGNVMISPFLMGRCAEDGRSVVLLDRNGHFMCRIVWKVSGNVLVRQAQCEQVRAPEKTVSIARKVVAGKVKNSRQTILRTARDISIGEEEERLRKTANLLADSLFRLGKAGDIDTVRGLEGEAAAEYFKVFDLMLKEGERTVFGFRE